MSEKTTSDLFLEYHQKIEEYLKIDELNLKDAQMSLPSVRHYWVGRLMFHKQQISKFKKAKFKTNNMSNFSFLNSFLTRLNVNSNS